MLTKIFCPSCGASDFIRLPNRNVKCNYCNSIFQLSQSDLKPFEYIVIKSDLSTGLKFAVHKKLLVTGDMNIIHISSVLDDATHVSKLKITGDGNNLTVILLDGSICKDKGDMNEWKK